MKSVGILFFLICQSINNLHAQHITNQNNSWNVVECINFVGCHTLNFYIGEDTVINDKVYKAFHQSNPLLSSSAFQIPDAIREDSLKRVYFYFSDSDREFLYYDFSLQAGDTAYIERDDHFMLSFIVGEVDSIVLENGEKRKRIKDQNFWPGEEWIEGIGSNFGIIQTSYDNLISDVYPRLLCFNENDTLKYLNAEYDTCFYETTDVEHLLTQNWLLYPSPMIDLAILKSDSEVLKNGQIKIYDLNGRLVYEKAGLKGNTIEINPNELMPGFYFYNLYDENTLNFTQKFIKI